VQSTVIFAVQVDVSSAKKLVFVVQPFHATLFLLLAPAVLHVLVAVLAVIPIRSKLVMHTNSARFVASLTAVKVTELVDLPVYVQEAAKVF